MKKIIILFFLLLTLSSCNNKSVENTSENIDKNIDSTVETNNITAVNNIVKNNVDNESNNEDLLSLYSKIKPKYKDNEEFNSCVTRETKTCLSRIITDEANKTMNTEICNDYLDEQSITSCKDNIGMLKAMKEKSINLCDDLSQSMKLPCKKSILREMALENKDPGICKNILSNYSDKSESNSGTLNDQETVNVNIDEREKEEVERCVEDISMRLAEVENDKKYCKGISKITERKRCESQVKVEEETKNDENK